MDLGCDGLSLPPGKDNTKNNHKKLHGRKTDRIQIYHEKNFA